MKVIRTAIITGVLVMCAFSQTEIQLPEPNKTGGLPIMDALAKRQSSRTFSDRPLPEQVLSDLLWAAWGINRPESGKRTAPSARNWQETDVYVAMPDGAYIYDAEGHRLLPHMAEDIREMTGRQEFTQVAPVNLIFVSDQSKMGKMDQCRKDMYTGVDVGYISQNVYLFCASEELSTVVIGSLDKEALAEKLNLPEGSRVAFTQTVGYAE